MIVPGSSQIAKALKPAAKATGRELLEELPISQLTKNDEGGQFLKNAIEKGLNPDAIKEQSYVSWSKQYDPIFDFEGNEVGENSYVLIDRVFVPKEARGLGLGKEMLRKELQAIKNEYPDDEIKLAALPFDGGMNQEDLVKFYEKEGFDVTDTAGDAVIMTFDGKIRGNADPKLLAAVGAGGVALASGAKADGAEQVSKKDEKPVNTFSQFDYSFVNYIPQEQLKDISPSSLDVWGAAFATENSFGSFYKSIQNKEDFGYVEGYEPLDDIQGYEDYAEAFADSYSPQQTAAIKARIDEQRANREILNSSGAEGIAAMITAGVSDPLYIPSMLVGLGELRAGSTVLRAVAKSSLSGGAAEVPVEVVKQATQESRTAQEGAIAIGGATLVSGVLGGALNGLAKKQFDEIVKAVDDEIEGVTPQLETPEAPRSVGAAQNVTLAPEDYTLVKEKAVKTLGSIAPGQGVTPVIRLSTSESSETRQIVNQLVENPLVTKAAKEGKTVVPEGGSAETRIKLWDAGRYQAKKFQTDAYSRYRKRIKGTGQKPLTKLQFSEEAGKAARRNDTHIIPEVEETAKIYRDKVFNPMKDESINLTLLPEGIDVSTADSYLTRLYNARKIIAKRDEWDKIVGDWFKRMRAQAQADLAAKQASGKNISQSLQAQAGVSDAEIKEAVDSITNNILGTPSGKIPYGLKVTVRGPLKERVLNIPDKYIEDFLESDIDRVAQQYTRTMAPDIELTKMFGDVDMSAQIKSVIDDYDVKMSKAKTAAEREKINNAKKRDLEDLEALRDRLRGAYNTPKNPDSLWVRAPRAFRAINYLRMLGGMTLSALPDLGNLITVNGLKPLGKGLKTLVTDIDRIKMSKKEIEKAAVGLEYVLGSRATGIAADVFDDYGRHTRFERGLDAMGDAFGKMTLMAQWNATLKQFAGIITQDRILTECDNWVKGKISQNAKARLAQAGIDEQLAERIVEQFKLHGEDGTIKLSGGEAWDDGIAIGALRAAILKDVDRTVATAGAGETPLFMSSETGKLIMQFKTFAFVAHQKVMIPSIQYADAQVLTGLTTSVALGSAVYALKQKLADKEIDTNPTTLIKEGVDRSGITGYTMDINNAVEKWSDGTYGLNAMLGTPQASRYATRGKIGAFLGPSLGTAEDIFDITGAMATGEFGEKEAGQARRLLPFQNLFYLRWLFNELEKSASGELE